MVTFLLILATILAYGLELTLGGLPVCETHGLIPASFTGDLTPIFTSLFLHDPATVYHLAGNMAALLLFGLVVERDLGSLALLAVYGFAGLAGGLLHVAVDPSSTSPLVGASGAIFGVMAVAGALRPRLIGFVVGFGAIEVWRALTGGDVAVSFGCHIGGLAGGVVVAMGLRATGTWEAAVSSQVSRRHSRP